MIQTVEKFTAKVLVVVMLHREGTVEEAKGKRLSECQLVPLGETGFKIPALGYGIGTYWYQTKDKKRGELLTSCIEKSLEKGFIHLDEAEMYENAKWLRPALENWFNADPENHKRENLFITGKIMRVDRGVRRVCVHNLKTVGLDYYDLFLIHAPFKKNAMPFKASLRDIWKQMEALVDEGLVKSIGVSNFRIQDMEEILESCRIKPCCNQIEFHPYLQQKTLMEFHRKHNITVASFGSLVPLTKLKKGPVNSILESLSKRLSRTPGQILIRWNLQMGNIVISTTSKESRMKEYIEIFDFELAEEDVVAITKAGCSRPEKRTFWSNKKLDQLWATTMRTSLYFMQRLFLKFPRYMTLKNK